MIGDEIFRLLKLSREYDGDELLTQALSGRERTAGHMTRLFGFVTEHFGQDSATAEQVWKPIRPLLADAGVTETGLKKIRWPHKKAGDTGFKSILDEFREQGWEEYEFHTTKLSK